MLLISVLLGGSRVMADEALFTFNSSSAPTTVDAISITGGTTSNNGYNASSTISVNAATGNTITAIAFTFADNSSNRNGGTVTVSSGTYAPDGASGSWSGSANAVTFTPSGKFRITAMTVTYTNNTTGDKATSINISDLRFEHQTYDPSRSGVRGFNITTSGWQSYTTVGSPNVYTLLLTNMNSNSITVSTTNSAKIKQFMLVGAGGVNTFNNATVTSANTRKTTTTTEGGDVVGVIVWENTSGATSATISFTSTDRPHVYSLYIITDTEMPTTKQSVVLSFDPNTGTAGKGLTDFSIDGRVKASIAGGTPEYFRADDFTSSSVTNSGSEAEFYQFHLSTGYVGVNTGSETGTATITAKFTGNDYYEAATSGTYTLNIQDNSTKTLAVSVDDMRISKKGNANGLNATSGFDRVMGGFKFDFDGDENVKFNNDNYLIFRNSGGKVTITPQKKEGETGDIKITRVDINTISSYTNGVVTVSGLDGDQTINGVSSHSFANLKTEGDDGVTDFTMTSSSGNIYVTGFTIYYTDPNGVLNSEKVTPTFTFTPTSHTVNKGDTYTSPAISAYPDNFDFDITTDNANVANVGTTGGEASGLIALQGGIGTAHITARAGESTFFNAAEDATYTVTVNSTNAKKWDFTTLDVTNTIGSDATEWKSNGEYYNNQFITLATTNGATISASDDAYWTTDKTGSQIYGLLFGRQNSSGLSTGNIRLYSSYLTANNSAVVIAVPATEGQKVIVTFDGGNGTTQQGFDFTNATLEGDASATSIKSDETQRVATLTAGAGGYITLKFTTSKVRLYSIEVSDETRKTLTLADVNNTYERAVSETTFSHHVKFTASDGATDALSYDSDKDYLHITSSNENVLKVTPPEVSAADFGSGSSFAFDGIKAVGPGTATLTITFDGNNEYKPTSYTSQVYTVSGTMTAFTVTADDQAIQQGQRSPIEPMITNANGQLIGIRGTSGNYETYVLGDEDDIPNYADFFDFIYTAGSGSGTNYNNITVTDGTVYVADGVGIGATRNIAITATVKEQYNSAFGGTSVSANATMTVTVRAKTSGNPCTYYWNSNLTDNQVTTTDYSTEEGSSMGIFGKNESGKTFASGFPNGRVMYVKPNNADDVVFFSYAVNGEPGDFPAQPKYDKDKKIYIYRRGIPIYIDEDFTNGSSCVRVNVATASYDASTKKYTLNSGVVKMKFIMTTHERPDQPTYDPISPASEPTLNQDGRRIMNTAQNVVAYGEGASKGVAGSNNLVYGKFSTSSVYTTAQLINEETVSEGRDNVPVISTEVNKRRFTAVQIKNYTGGAEPCGYGDYISEQTYTEYYYLYDTEMRLTPASVNISPNTSVPSNDAPQVTVTWYNKKTGAKQEVETYDGKITYAITGAYNLTYGQESGNDVSVDATTGIVTSLTDKQGWVKVTATYAGGEEHGDKTGEPQYKSTTDKSTADFYVYIYDTTKQRPTITPTTRNFTGTMTYTITAPESWDVVYTTDGSDPVVPGYGTTPANYIEHAQHVDKGIGEAGDGVDFTVAVDGTHTVKAVAYTYSADDSHTISSSAVVSESYTRKAPLPDPVFDPDGTDKDKDGTLDVYQYNTSTLTVQIACAYAGSEIYYTTDGTTPEIGNENTYKYSGLSKVVISGDVTIKAVAYDPANKIFSNIVPSGYRYSDKMDKPYFQISDDGGSTWYGFSDASTWAQNGTAWNNGQSHEITPSTQIRIVDPNPVAGTIYYTLDGSAPSNDASSFVYFEGYPFTVGKNTTGKAITTLEDASSEPATAEFTIKSSFGNVWEAVDETMTGETKHKGIHADDGFVISTVASLAVANTGTTVNKYSIKGETNAQGATNNVSFAQADITATFGGYDLASWEEMDIADKATGAPIGNVGQYSIRNINDTGIGNGNARDESNKNYNHIYSYKTDADKAKTEVETPATTHEKTFKIPAIGDYVRFEPEKDGDLTIWCLQQGALLYEDDKYFIPNVLRIRPVYLVDEQGKSYHVKTINGVPQLWSSARLSENWTKIQETAAANSWMDSHLNSAGTDMEDNELYVQYLRYSDGALFQDEPDDYEEDPSKYKYMLNKGPNKAETAAIYNLYKADLDKNHVSVGDPIKPFALHTGSNLSLNAGMYIDNSDDGTGYVLASGGFAKYTFEVKAGKTYYFFAQGSKIGIRGFQFVPTETGTRHAVTITKTGESYTVDSETKTPAEAIAECADKPADVTLSGRTFAADTWASLVLPFSVSVAQVEKVFGAHTDIIHFNDIKTWGDGYKLYMKRHWHKMIVAGTPILIKPTQKVENPTFHGVQLEASDVTDMTAATVSDQYKMTGVLVKTDGALRKDDYYINTSGKLTHMNAASSNVNATYAWIKYLGVPNQAKSLTVSITDFENEMIDDDETTGIQVALFEESGINTFGSDDNVYNLNGMKVADGASLNNLPKGIYIVKGKKVIVK